MSFIVEKKFKQGLCGACGRSTRLHVHQGCGKRLEALHDAARKRRAGLAKARKQVAR